MNIPLVLKTRVDLEDLAYSLSKAEISYEDLLKFIVMLDQNIGDLDFTEMLLNYCMDEWEKHKHLREDHE